MQRTRCPTNNLLVHVSSSTRLDKFDIKSITNICKHGLKILK